MLSQNEEYCTTLVYESIMYNFLSSRLTRMKTSRLLLHFAMGFEA